MADWQPVDPTVVIFGAGATRGGLRTQPIPPPVDAEFFSVANRLTGHGTPEIAKRVLKSVWELYGKVDGVGLEDYYREIETRAAIGLIAKAAGKPKDWRNRQTDLEELIRRVYVHTTTREVKGKREPCVSLAHRRILKALSSSSTVLTFNYDMVIEEAFADASLWNPRDGYGVKLPGITLDWARIWLRTRNAGKDARSKLLLLKLHGSLGWAAYRNRIVKLKPRPYYVRTGTFERVEVLPPGWNKRIDLNPYRRFWREARLRLQSCRSLLIVGYSLPETDLLARALFAEVVRHRAVGRRYLDRLVLVDPNTQIRARFIKLFTPALGPLATILQFDSLEQFAGA